MTETTKISDEARFNELATKWRRETSHLLDSNRVLNHPAHQEIIKMGEVALPFIFKTLINDHGHWFFALQEITGEDPIDEEYVTIPRAREIWVEWGKQHGYC